MIGFTKGTPFVGTVSLTNGAPGPTAFTIKVTRSTGSGNYSVGTQDRLCIMNIIVSSNDTANPLVSILDGAGTSTTLFKAYTATSIPTPACYAAGVLMGTLGIIPVASAPAVSAAKTVEITINGVIVTGT